MQPPASLIRHGSPTPISKPAGALRIGNYNVENLFDDKDDPALSGRYEDKDNLKPDDHCKAAAAAIRAINADVLALQELESKESLIWFRDNYLADLGYQYVESIDAGDERGIEQGVLSRYPLSDVKNWVHLDLGGTHPDKWGNSSNENAGKPITFHRSPLRVTVTVPLSLIPGMTPASVPEPYTVTLFVVHQKSGGSGNYWREKEAAKTVELLSEFETSNPQANILLMGDFNARPDDNPIKIITSGLPGLVDAFAPVRGKRDSQYMTHASDRSIDYIFLNANAAKELIAETRFILGTPTRPAGTDYRTTPPPPGYASDHYPVVIDLVPADK